MKTFFFIISFLLINTAVFEWCINKGESTALTLLAVAIFFTSGYFLIYKPLKKLL